jgi:glutathione S-transferase
MVLLRRRRCFNGFPSKQTTYNRAWAALRYWTLTGKIPARPRSLIDGKRATAIRALDILNRELSARPFIAGDYSIADISLFAYAHLAGDAGIATAHLPAFESWVTRVRSQNRFLAEMYPYSIDPHSTKELP